MEGYETAREAAERLGYEYTYFVRDILNTGRIPSAFRFGRAWVVPTSVKPEDVRKPLGRPSVPARYRQNKEER